MPMEEKRKKSLANIGEWASSATDRKPEPPPMEMPPVSRAMLDALNPKKPPPPINIRLETMRAMDDDALMKWLTTESEHPGRPLDGGSKMAITMELMRRQSQKAERPTWWKDPYFWVAAVAAVFAGVAAYPVLSPGQMQPTEAASKSAPAPTESPHSTPAPESGKPKSAAK